jgi:ABC-2 type transport system ATP-binding protein
VSHSNLPILEVAGATRRYGSTAALLDVNLHISQGEVYAIVGRNGAGKSTLAKAVIGALSLDSGTIGVQQRDPFSDPLARRAIGMAPQEVALYPHLTIAENVEAFATLAGVRTGRDAAVRRAIDEAACSERADQRIDRLSGGWRRRANLAAAIVHKPQLLVLDEPTEGLDAETRVALRRLIERLRERGTAILLISHNADDVSGLANRVGILDRGRLLIDGAPEALIKQAFGERQALAIRLATTSPQAIEYLRSCGLLSADEGTSWLGLVDDAATLAHSIDQSLRKMGCATREIAVRPPAIDALISWAAGEEIPLCG